MINRIMKGSVIALFLVFIFSFLALAENQPEPRLISVTGEAEVKVVPDEVVLTLGVETWDKDLNVAKNQNDERVKKVLAVAKKHKIQSKDTQTDCISIEPRYEDQWQHRNFAGYFVSKRIALTLRDISKFEGLLSNSLEAGANYVYGIRFRTTELRKYK
ncbi:MAG: SIMPL domain-containing protein, partial [candidate division Zixibacteria bacterium]|nr:SIMPL domain-containing protein [candidate division Zixibacteria bacterium]